MSSKPLSLSKRLPFKPETFEGIKARLPIALVDVYEIHTEPRPGLQRKHVFDFQDGVRMIISRDAVDGDSCVHVSASAFGLEIDRIVSRGPQYFVDKIKKRWLELGRNPLDFAGFSLEKGVPHFVETKID